MGKKGFASLILIAIFAIFALGIAIFILAPRLAQQTKNQLTFIVTVPQTTPVDDTIVLHYYLKKVPLKKVGEFKYQGEIDKSEVSPEERLEYGYSRGGFHPFGEKGMANEEGSRELVIGDQKVIQDTILEWKWLPKETLNEQDISSLASKISFQERPKFWKGVQFIDFWDMSWPYQYTSTINHLKAHGYGWISLAPPWDIKNDDPPKISGIDVKVPAYSDEKLREHIRVFKKAGFKVMLSPQVCCEPISFEGRDEAWWQKWYDEFEDFVKYHADLAKVERVDALLLGYDLTLPLDPKSPSFASERWKRIIQIAKSSGVLVGYMALAWGASYEDTMPQPSEFIDFWSELDFMGVGLSSDVVSIQNPSQEDIDRGMETIFDKLEVAHQKLGKQIILTGVDYESIKGAGLEKRPETFYTWEDPDKIPVKYSAEEQAMIYEALMRQVADKEYIEGIFSFGYWYVDAPLTVDSSIRGKMAERILTNWFEHIPD